MMKVIIIFLALLLSSVNGIADTVDVQTAKQVALNFIKQNDQLKSTAIILTETPIKIDNNLVAYHFETNTGSVIVSAENCVVPILAWSDEGVISLENAPHFVKTLFNHYARQIIASRKLKSKVNSDVTKEWSSLLSSTQLKGLKASISPMLTTTWNQNPYYNDSCPGLSLTGCVAACMAQLMKYYSWPMSGFHKHVYTEATYGLLGVNYGNASYNWSMMPVVVKDTTNLQKRAEVAKLMYHCGAAINMTYTLSNSSATTANIRKVLPNYFKYVPNADYIYRTNYTSTSWDSLMHIEIDNNHPIIYAGENVDATSSHAFIIDGYQDDFYYHINWGWGGSYNGFFYLNDLTPSTRDYTYDQRMLIKMKPSFSPNLSYPYTCDFESDIPSEMLCFRDVSLTNIDKHSGNYSLYFNSSVSTAIENKMFFKINVPISPSSLSFWIKRAHSAASGFMSVSAYVRPEYWVDTMESKNQILDTIFSGDISDLNWANIVVSLNKWSGQNITLSIEQKDNSSTRYNWIYLDDISISLTTSEDEIKSEKLKVFSDGYHIVVDNQDYKALKTELRSITGKLLLQERISGIRKIPLSTGSYIVNISTNEEVKSFKISHIHQ